MSLISENAKITTLIENRTIVYPKTVKEAVYGLEEELNKKEVTIGSTPDEDAVLWIEPDGDVTTPIYAPNIAQVGQTIVVSAVDENGRPTAWEAVDMPQGGSGGEEWELIGEVVLEESAGVVEFPLSYPYKKLLTFVKQKYVESTSYNYWQAYVDGHAIFGNNMNSYSNFYYSYGWFEIIDQNFMYVLQSNSNVKVANVGSYMSDNGVGEAFENKIAFRFASPQYPITFDVGSEFKVYGVRA